MSISGIKSKSVISQKCHFSHTEDFQFQRWIAGPPPPHAQWRGSPQLASHRISRTSASTPSRPQDPNRRSGGRGKQARPCLIFPRPRSRARLPWSSTAYVLRVSSLPPPMDRPLPRAMPSLFGRRETHSKKIWCWRGWRSQRLTGRIGTGQLP